MNRLRNSIAFSILPQILAVIWARQHPEFIESWYSLGIYPAISAFFRTLYGWVPFSVGDCLYFLLGIMGIWYLVRNRRKIRNKPLQFLRNTLVVLSVAYFSFHLLWGLNYYREPLIKNLDITGAYTFDELQAVTRDLIAKTNALHGELTAKSDEAVEFPFSRDSISALTLEGYENLRKKFPYLSYTHPSLKTSLYSTALTYMGYGGYLNPFTNEAQVNGKIPLFRYPVICGHEIGHQLGYSAENETNFIGYLVTASNSNPYFRYAASAYAASYCLAEIQQKNPENYKALFNSFRPGVQKNFQALEDFWKMYENPMEPVFKSVFSTFLKANNQAEGIRSYNRIVTLLVGYHKKHPVM